MKQSHILVIRISSMGDVAMTVPVLQQLLQKYPGIKLTVLTQPNFFPLFETLERTDVQAADIKWKHKGITGLFKLFFDLRKKYRYDAVADLHNVLRSQLLRFLFRLSGIKMAVINKGRKKKRQLTNLKHKRLRQLKTTFQRYADVFAKLGFPVKLDTSKQVFPKQQLPAETLPFFEYGKKYVTIAPFARHPEKMYPAAKMKKVIQLLSEQPNIQLFFVGGGRWEMERLNKLENEFPGTTNLSGKFSFKDELAILSNMHAVVSMDSANMHLASLFGVPVISIWGATHPFLGFYGWGQSNENAIQSSFYCRPCSVFGNKPCFRGDRECMERIREKSVVDRIINVINDHSSI